MAETGSATNPMRIWTIILGGLIVVLIVVVAVLAAQLNKTNSKLTDTEQQLTSTKADLNTAQTALSTTKGELAASTANATGLQNNLTTANAQIKDLNTKADASAKTIGQQALQIRTMMYPHNFSTIEELTNWLQKNNSKTVDFNSTTALQRVQMAFALEIRASRDGYLMPVALPLLGSLDLVTNRAIVGDVVYDVRAWDNLVQLGGRITPALPSYPIPPDSGQ